MNVEAIMEIIHTSIKIKLPNMKPVSYKEKGRLEILIIRIYVKTPVARTKFIKLAKKKIGF